MLFRSGGTYGTVPNTQAPDWYNRTANAMGTGMQRYVDNTRSEIQHGAHLIHEAGEGPQGVNAWKAPVGAAMMYAAPLAGAASTVGDYVGDITTPAVGKATGIIAGLYTPGQLYKAGKTVVEGFEHAPQVVSKVKQLFQPKKIGRAHV